MLYQKQIFFTSTLKLDEFLPALFGSPNELFLLLWYVEISSTFFTSKRNIHATMLAGTKAATNAAMPRHLYIIFLAEWISNFQGRNDHWERPTSFNSFTVDTIAAIKDEFDLIQWFKSYFKALNILFSLKCFFINCLATQALKNK